MKQHAVWALCLAFSFLLSAASAQDATSKDKDSGTKQDSDQTQAGQKEPGEEPGYNLPEAWQVGLAPTISYNHQAPTDEAWNIPVGVMFAKTVKIGTKIIKFQFGIEYSVLSQDTYGKEVMFRLNVIPVIKSLFKEPIF